MSDQGSDKAKFVEKFTLFIKLYKRFKDKRFYYEYEDIDKIGENYRLAHTIFKFVKQKIKS